MTDRAPDGYVDVDTTDEFLDVAVPRYQPHGRPASLKATDDLLERAERGEIDLPKLPPPIER